MRDRKNKKTHTEDTKKTGKLPSSGIPRATEESGPFIFPGLEDAGIGPAKQDLYGDGWDDPDEEDLLYDSPDDHPDVPGGDDVLPGGSPGRLNGPFRFIAGAFILMFLLLIGNLVYFNVREKDSVLNSPYNRRQNSQAERVIRGMIKSVDGEILARTERDEEGNETRVYPYSNLFAHTVGYMTHGKSGLESVANYQLLTAHNNIIDQVINEFLKKKNPGDTVVTTMNASLQEACYYALGDYRGAVIVLDPGTGAIKAMVSKPDFDPNTLAYVWDDMVSDPSNSQLLNRATQGLYPPGSMFKIVTALSYYRRYGTFSGFTYDCTGEFSIDDSTVHCYKGTAHGEETFEEAFAHSCNTAFSKIGLALGAGRLSDTAKDMLFSKRLPCELYSSRTKWQLTSSSDDIELVQTAFGQGKTLTTPYHMALLCSAIANHGIIMTPYLTDHIENHQGKRISTTSPSRYKRIMTEEEADVLSSLMEKVVQSGTAAELSGRDYTVAGKTGSAEYYRSDGSMGTHSWFVGFTNPGDPDIVIVVLAENGGAGSSTAVPIAGEILRSYYGY